MIIIDIRNNMKYNNGHINNAININELELEINYKKYLNKDKKYIIYCDSGHRSKILSNKLKRLGYNVESLEGGYNKYKLM